MKEEMSARQKYLYASAAVVLIVGLGSSAVIYFTASSPNGAELLEGIENSKRYIHNLEVYGGKMNVLMDQFTRWFESLWQGKALAGSVALITVILSLCLFLVAYNHPPDSDSGKKSDWLP